LNGCIFDMYSELKFLRMKVLFMFLIVVSFQTIAQSNVEEQLQNTNTNSAPSISVQENDTILKDLRETESVKGQSVKKNKSAIRSEAPVEIESKSTSSAAASSTFTTTRSAAVQSRTQRTPSAQYQQQMDMVVEQLESQAPESFEYHFFKYQAGNYDVSLVDHLNKAEQLKPGNSDVHLQKAAYHFIMNEESKVLTYLEKLVSSKRLGSDVLNYGKDLLLSAPQNGVLVTHGSDDTYSVLYHQMKNSVREDVRIISLDLMQSAKFREDLQKDNFTLPKRELIDVTYLAQFCQMNASKGLSLSLTFPKEYLVGISDRIYITGLVFVYTTDNRFNNFDRNDELWNSVLEKKATSEVYTEKAKQLSANYLPMLLLLSQVYGDLNETAKKNSVDEEIDRISVQCNKYEQVRQIKSSY
jgi:hypothetical protein